MDRSITIKGKEYPYLLGFNEVRSYFKRKNISAEKILDSLSDFDTPIELGALALNKGSKRKKRALDLNADKLAILIDGDPNPGKVYTQLGELAGECISSIFSPEAEEEGE